MVLRSGQLPEEEERECPEHKSTGRKKQKAQSERHLQRWPSWWQQCTQNIKKYRWPDTKHMAKMLKTTQKQNVESNK